MYEVDQYTVSLLHFDDGLKDESGKVWTAYNGSTTSTTQSKFGGSSLYLNGTQYMTTPLTADLKLVSNDFTIDFWVYPTSLGANKIIFCTNAVNIFTGVAIYCTDTTIYGVISTNGTSWISATNKITLNKWNHVAFIKTGNKINVAVNGIMGNSATLNGSPVESSCNYAVIGNVLGQDAFNYYYNGYIDEFRISNIARWTSDFDPGATPQVPSGNGLLRITMNDSSEREYQLSAVEIDDFVKWFNRTIGTGTTGYVFNKNVQNSKEYLSFEKIISFEVIPLTV